MEEIYDIKGYEKIYGITKNGYEIKRKLGYDNSTIAKRCKDHKKGYGYYWRYANESGRTEKNNK